MHPDHDTFLSHADEPPTDESLAAILAEIHDEIRSAELSLRAAGERLLDANRELGPEPDLFDPIAHAINPLYVPLSEAVAATERAAASERGTAKVIQIMRGENAHLTALQQLFKVIDGGAA